MSATKANPDRNMSYWLVDKDISQLRLVKLYITNINENYFSYDVLSIALAYFLNPLTQAGNTLFNSV
jgi:hypothetical protein